MENSLSMSPSILAHKRIYGFYQFLVIESLHPWSKRNSMNFEHGRPLTDKNWFIPQTSPVVRKSMFRPCLHPLQDTRCRTAEESNPDGVTMERKFSLSHRIIN